MSFITDENKSFIWNIILESGGFNNIPESRIDNVKNLLDEKFIEINNLYKDSKNTKLELNKFLLSSINNDLQLYKINQDANSLTRQSNNLIEFNKKYNDLQNNMNQYLNTKQPEQPNFEDKNLNVEYSSPIDLNNSYNDFIKKRENEILDILPSLQNEKNKYEHKEEYKEEYKEEHKEEHKEQDKSEYKQEYREEHSEEHKEKNNKKKTISFLDLSQELFNNEIVSNSKSINSKNQYDSLRELKKIKGTDSHNLYENINIVNKNIEEIKIIEKKLKNNEQEIDNKFNLNNKLNLIIQNQDKILDKYNDLKDELNNIKIVIESIFVKLNN